MVKHTQTTRRQQPTNCLGVFDHFVGLAPTGLKGLPLKAKLQSNVFIFKGYLRYKTITSQNMPSEAQIKFFVS